MLVGRGGVEPPTFHFSGGRSYQLSYLPKRTKLYNTLSRKRESTGSPSAVGQRASSVADMARDLSTNRPSSMPVTSTVPESRNG